MSLVSKYVLVGIQQFVFKSVGSQLLDAFLSLVPYDNKIYIDPSLLLYILLAFLSLRSGP